MQGVNPGGHRRKKPVPPARGDGDLSGKGGCSEPRAVNRVGLIAGSRAPGPAVVDTGHPDDGM